MGVTQSDEFCEVYDRFMASYNQGKCAADIRNEILGQYHAEFDDADGVMHDVYFALAKAEWMCCAQSDCILHRVKDIIDSGANIEFYRELGASASDLVMRRKKLAQFYQSLQTPRKAPRKRYVESEKTFPPFQPGDCFAYNYAPGKRVLIILDRYQMPGWQEQAFICILKKTFTPAALKFIDYMNEEVAVVTCLIASEFIGKTLLKKLGTIPVPLNAKNLILGENALFIKSGGKKIFKQDYAGLPSIPLHQVLSHRPNQVKKET